MASQLGARKKGVEKRSFVLTTLCSVDLKRPFVHLPQQVTSFRSSEDNMLGFLIAYPCASLLFCIGNADLTRQLLACRSCHTHSSCT